MFLLFVTELVRVRVYQADRVSLFDRVVLRRIEVGMLDDPGPLLKVDPISSR